VSSRRPNRYTSPSARPYIPTSPPLLHTTSKFQKTQPSRTTQLSKSLSITRRSVSKLRPRSSSLNSLFVSFPSRATSLNSPRVTKRERVSGVSGSSIAVLQSLGGEKNEIGFCVTPSCNSCRTESSCGNKRVSKLKGGVVMRWWRDLWIVRLACLRVKTVQMVEKRTCARWILLCWVLQQGEKIKVKRSSAMKYDLRIDRLGWRTRSALVIEGRPVLT
jgi:hypothetical protein